MKSERISPFWVNGYQPFSALRQSFSNLFAHESDKFLRLYYGFFIKESDILKRPLSKMKQDIAKQIGLI